MEFVIVFLGAGLGGAARHGTNILAARLFGTGFPFGTLTANLIGSLLMAVIMETFALRSGLSMQARLFLTTGVLGGYTTFSTFTLDAMLRIQRGEWAMAATYILASVVGGLMAFALGMALVRQVVGAAS